MQDPDGSTDPWGKSAGEGCRIHMDPPIQGAKVLVRSAGSRWIHRSMGQKCLRGVQDPDGSTDPGGKNACEGCRIQMDPLIQGAKMLVRVENLKT